MILIKTYNQHELKTFIESGDYKKFEFLPMSKHRGLSQVKNPKANPNDVLLILALKDDKLAGYLGLLPDNFTINTQKIGYAWFSTLFVSEKFRGQKIAQKLISQAFESYEQHIAITEFTAEAESLYNKTGEFIYGKPKIGKRYYLRSALTELLPRKRQIFKKLSPILPTVDLAANLIFKVKNGKIKKPAFKFEILNQTDDESRNFLSNFYSYRSANDLDWIMENPWIKEGTPDSNYLFSDFAPSFNFFWVKVYDAADTLETCALLQLRDGHLKIPYLFCKNTPQNFAQFLNWFAEEKKTKILTSYQENLNTFLDQPNFSKLHSKRFERRYLFHKKLLNQLPPAFDPHYQDGDGDCVFT